MYQQETFFFSVIVPIYNTEKYLSEAIDSVLYKQGIKNIELILVNDGSTDSSGEVANSYANIEDRVIVCHQQNKGLSAARNQGLRLAKGEYIVFLDSDDWLKKGSLEILYDIAKRNNPDIIVGNTLFYYSDDKIVKRYDSIPDDIKKIDISGKKCFVKLIKHFSFAPMVYNYIYKRSWLNEIQMQFLDVIHEDELWTPTALCQARQAFVADLDFYYYRQRENSIMSLSAAKNINHQKRRAESLFTIVRELLLFAENYQDKEDYELKSWLYVKIAELLHYAYSTLVKIKEPQFMPQEVDFSYFKDISDWMLPFPKQIFITHFNQTYLKMKEYQQL